MTLSELFKDASKKPKEKTELLAQMLSAGDISLTELMQFADNAKDAICGTCVEAMEYAIRADERIASPELLQFVTRQLSHTAPRVKWESAKVIAQIAHLYPDQLDDACTALLAHTDHKGTVVRWSAAYALGNILELKNDLYPLLRPALEQVTAIEEKNSIRKIYQDALKKSL